MPQSQSEVAQERMLEDAKKFILASGEFRTVPELAQLLQVVSRKLNQQLVAWRDSCRETRRESLGELLFLSLLELPFHFTTVQWVADSFAAFVRAAEDTA